MSATRALHNADWLTSGPAARVLTLLNADGEEARVVGGAVRNALLGLPVGEIDIATTALPEEVINRAKRARIKSVPTGIEHGTVTLVIENKAFEVTTLREDVETFGRRAKVVFGRDWMSDALRRDFTINGLSVSLDGVVHDHVGGLADIETRRVRFIGEPAQRIAEDYLRILRFFRIHAAYGMGEPDVAAYDACIAGRDGLCTLSAERIRMEVLKLVLAPGAAAALVAMDNGGLLRFTGGVVYHGVFAKMVAAEAQLGLDPNPIRRLGALAVAVTEDARRLSQRMRLSNAETKRLDSMGHRWWRLKDMDEDIAQRRFYRIGDPCRYLDRIMLAWARAGRDATSPYWQKFVSLPDRWTPPVFPLKGGDFIARGIAEGPTLGHVLTLAEDAWLAARFPMDEAALKTIADETAVRFTRDHLL
jgi:poly(A) polymerase/tRNA nucleotidyltransferase (CCA-adding enzyme)